MCLHFALSFSLIPSNMAKAILTFEPFQILFSSNGALDLQALSSGLSEESGVPVSHSVWGSIFVRLVVSPVLFWFFVWQWKVLESLGCLVVTHPETFFRKLNSTDGYEGRDRCCLSSKLYLWHGDLEWKFLEKIVFGCCCCCFYQEIRVWISL